jgi:hypothetical protein
MKIQHKIQYQHLVNRNKKLEEKKLVLNIHIL